MVEDFMMEDEEDPLVSVEYMNPPLLSDSEPSDSENDEESEDDDIDTPIYHRLNNQLNRSVARGHEDQNPSGARVWTEPHEDTKEEHQEVTHEMLLHFLEINEERNAVMETATAESPPVAEPTPILRSEQVISTAEEPPAELNPQDKEVDFDSEDDQALLDCVQLNLEAEDIFKKVG